MSGERLLPVEKQPYGVEIHMADGIFIKQMTVEKAYTIIPQHSHTYDHTSMIAKGSFRAWKNNVLLGDFTAPTGLLIEAGNKHLFQSLEDHSVIYCIHNVERTGKVEIMDEHTIIDGVLCPPAGGA